MPELELDRLTKSFAKGATALREVSLSVERGEFIVLVGPSGCGKSTLLRLIAGLDEPTEGMIRIGGRDVTRAEPAERGVAMVFQDYALYPHMSVRENLAFGLKMRKVPIREIAERVQRTAELLAIGELLERKPAQLSGGQRQRVAIGRAMIKEPRVFLLDEPLSNLDAQLRAQTRIELAALHRRIGSTTVYVTHDQEEAMTLADRVVVLERGIVHQISPPLEVYSRPADRFVASFMGNPAMNFLEGELRDGIFAGDGFHIDLRGAPGLPRDGAYALGARPEALRLAGPGPQGADLRLRVEGVEPLGYEARVIGRVGTRQLVVRAPASDAGLARAGAEIGARLDREAIRWFAPGGEAVRGGAGAAQSR